MATTTDTTPVFINTLSMYAHGLGYAASAVSPGNAASATWPVANRAIYCPLTLPFSYSVSRIFVANGAAVAGNIDLGVYDATGTKVLTTGAVAQAGITVNQYVSFAVTLAPGNYYLALVLSNAAGTTIRTNAYSTQDMRIQGVLEQAGASPLPATMSPATPISSYVPLFGITRSASGF